MENEGVGSLGMGVVNYNVDEEDQNPMEKIRDLRDEYRRPKIQRIKS